MKRFYSHADTAPGPEGGHTVTLDGRPLQTPARAPMLAPTRALAEAVAAEWRAQRETIAPETMPLTHYLATAIDRAGPERDALAKAALAYLDSDLLCYRADAPESLARAQQRLWDPWLHWFETRFGAALETTPHLARLTQPAKAHAAAADAVHALDLHRFTILQAITSLTGSVVLALAFTQGALDPESAYACALCEELHYEHIHDLARHGPHPDEALRRAALRRDLEAARVYLALVAEASISARATFSD